MTELTLSNGKVLKMEKPVDWKAIPNKFSDKASKAIKKASKELKKDYKGSVSFHEPIGSPVGWISPPYDPWGTPYTPVYKSKPKSYYTFHSFDGGTFDDPFAESKTTELKTSGNSVFLKLLDTPDGSVRLVSVDKDGTVTNYILDLTSKGAIRLYEGISTNLGFQLCKNGRIKIK